MRVSRSASNSTASSNYAHTLKSNLPSPAETLPSQYTEAPTSASLVNLGHSYSSPSIPPSYQTHDGLNTSPPIGHLGSSTTTTATTTFPENSQFTNSHPSNYSAALERSRSYQTTFTDYNNDGTDEDSTPTSNRYIKRPRASTTSSAAIGAPLYSHHNHHNNQANDTASAYAQASRSFSEQPGDLQHHHNHHRSCSLQASAALPSLSEEYDLVSPPPPPPHPMTEQVAVDHQGMYMPQPQRTTAVPSAGEF